MGNFASKTRVATNEPAREKDAFAPKPSASATTVTQRKTRSQTQREARRMKSPMQKEANGSSNVAKKSAVDTQQSAATRTSKKRTRGEQEDAPASSAKPPTKKKSKRTFKTWDERYVDLYAFHQEYGHTVVPSNPQYIGLANWLYVQKRRNRAESYRCSKLSKEQVAKLNKLGVDWKIGKKGEKRG